MATRTPKDATKTTTGAAKPKGKAAKAPPKAAKPAKPAKPAAAAKPKAAPKAQGKPAKAKAPKAAPAPAAPEFEPFPEPKRTSFAERFWHRLGMRAQKKEAEAHQREAELEFQEAEAQRERERREAEQRKAEAAEERRKAAKSARELKRAAEEEERRMAEDAKRAKAEAKRAQAEAKKAGKEERAAKARAAREAKAEAARLQQEQAQAEEDERRRREEQEREERLAEEARARQETVVDFEAEEEPEEEFEPEPELEPEPEPEPEPVPVKPMRAAKAVEVVVPDADEDEEEEEEEDEEPAPAPKAAAKPARAPVPEPATELDRHADKLAAELARMRSKPITIEVDEEADAVPTLPVGKAARKEEPKEVLQLDPAPPATVPEASAIRGLSIPEHYLLLAMHEGWDERTERNKPGALGGGLTGALLLELVLQGALKVQRDRFALQNADLDDAAEAVAKKLEQYDHLPSLKAMAELAKWVPQLLPAYKDRMARRGLLAHKQWRHLGLAYRSQTALLDEDAQERLRNKLARAIAGGGRPDAPTILSLGLLEASGLFGLVVPEGAQAYNRKRLNGLLGGKDVMGYKVDDQLKGIQEVAVRTILDNVRLMTVKG